MSTAAEYIKAQITEAENAKVRLDGKLEGLWDALHAVEREAETAEANRQRSKLGQPS